MFKLSKLSILCSYFVAKRDPISCPKFYFAREEIMERVLKYWSKHLIAKIIAPMIPIPEIASLYPIFGENDNYLSILFSFIYIYMKK